ncbi:hypothetical protein N7507_007081 [Penicillium longicatenatum]|nr:hypothetical protein N7507_007081 [Penicillium longicatenatum]
MTSISFGDKNRGFQVAYNSGSIHAEFHLPPERPETPPIPLSTVPFARDPDFVRRSSLLQSIHNKSSISGSRIALVGLGGVGKSQLAIEYSYQIRSESPETWVFWIHAGNEARFEQSFRDTAEQLKIPSRQDPKANIFKLVENWLRDENKGKWICILDNADDDKFLCSLPVIGNGVSMKKPPNASTKPLLEYIPRCRNGSIIITSRSREAALKMVKHKDLIEVNPMLRSEALELLQKTLDQPEESQGSQQLVEELEFIPLAIAQAAGFIRNRAPRYSVSRYLKDFQQSDSEAIKLLQKEAGYFDRDWEAKNSILVTWQISFGYLRHEKPSAVELLSLMSFFDRQDIPESVIRGQPLANSRTIRTKLSDESSDGESSGPDGGPEFEDDIATLRSFSFISIRENGTSFTMHRLVQLTTRAWLKCHGEIERWKNKFISNMHSEFPSGRYENWEKCRSLYPHVRSAIYQQPESRLCLLRWATLLYRGAWYALESGSIAEVREMASKSLKYRMKLLGADHEEALASTAMLAEGYSLEGLWEKAEQLELRVMETRKRKLGVGHPSTLTSMANLASTYRKRGLWEKAEQLELRVMETRKRKLGVDHPSTLTSMANLASTYSNQGRWEEAEELKMKVMEASKRKLGLDHPDTLTSMANLAATYRDRGRWEDAEQLELQVMETRKRKLGLDHPDTLTSMANLAATYSDQGRWEEAEELKMKVMEASKTKLGLDHPDTLTSMANLAATYSDQGRWEDAEQLFMQVVEMRKIKLGVDHPDTLTSISNLAATYSNQGRLEEAERLEMQVIEMSKTKRGVDHPYTLGSMANLASTYSNQGRWGEAEQLALQVMETRKRKLGVDHPDTLTSMANLAFIWKSSGYNYQALELLRDCLVKQKQNLGSNHYHTTASSQTLLKWETEMLEIAGR